MWPLLGVAVLLSGSVMASTFKNELKVHVITPKFRINWKSPRTLALTSGLNSIGNDYAPIGHFAVELNCETPNEYGVKNILTGMERMSKKESHKITLKKKLGLGSVFYNFAGNLQSAEQTSKEIELARQNKKLTTVIIPTSASRCQMGMKFLETWIESGSYNVYGGNKDVPAGEGSGCADFALEFFKIATSIEPRDDIMVRVKIPKNLIGDGDQKRVSFLKILATGQWADDLRDATMYVTPDTNKVIDFLHQDTLVVKDEYIYVMHLGLDVNFKLLPKDKMNSLRDQIQERAESLLPYAIQDYNFKFSYPKRETVQESWSKITVESKKKED